MKITKILIVILLLILTVGAVSASGDNATSDSLDFSDDDVLQTSFNSDILGNESVSGSFSDLNYIISNAKRNDVIQLDKDYIYDNATDYALVDGIEIAKRITVDGQGHEIDGSGLARVFIVSANSVTLKNINFVNGKSNDSGGAIDWGSLRGVISNCSFMNCTAGDGGAISASDITISGCSFMNCVRIRGVYGGGGALNLYGSTVSNCSFVNCYSDGEGGAVRVVDNYEISDCIFVNCSANNTGALRLFDKGKVLDCSFENCSSPTGNGAIYSNGNGPVSIRNCSFVNCSTLFGYDGAVDLTDEDWTISDCTFINCSSYQAGGALGLFGKGIASNCSFVKCYSAEGGGAIDIWNQYDDEDHLISIVDCSFSDCSSENISGAIWARLTYCSVSNSSFVNCSVTGSLTNGGGAIWGGYNVSGCTFENCSADNVGAVVMGLSNDGVNVTAYYVSDCSFVNCYSYNDGGAVVVSEAVVSNCSFVRCISDGACGAIRGGDNVTISGCSFVECSSEIWGGAIGFYRASNDVVSDCSFVDCSSEEGGAIGFIECFDGAVSDCSFMNCYAYDYAGAIFFDSKKCAADNCSFVNCAVEGNGGAILLSRGNNSVSDCSFVNCSADYGGAIFADYDNYATVSNSQFDNNIAFEGGGAIYSHDIITVDSSTFNDNLADNCYGGALYLKVKANIVNSTFKGNKAYKGNSIWGHESNLTAVSNKFMLASGENRDDILYGIPLKDIRAENYVYIGNRLVVEPAIDISCGDLSLGENENVKVSLPSDATGKITLNLFKEGKLIKTTTYDLINGVASDTFSNLGLGVYNITVSYPGDVNYYDTQCSAIFMVRPPVDITQNAHVGENVGISMDLINATGRVKVFVDGEEYLTYSILNNKLSCLFNTDDLAYGNHNVTLEYIGSSLDKNIFNHWDNQTNSYVPYQYDLYIAPVVIEVKQDLGTKSDNEGVVVIELPKDATGTIKVVVSGSKEMVVDVVGGIAKVDFSELKDGDYKVSFEYSGDSKYSGFTKQTQTALHNNVPDKIIAKDSSLIYTNKYSVTVKTKTDKAVGGVTVTFLIDGKTYKSVKANSKGVASVAISKLPGTYKITSKIQNITVIKSLTVKHLVTLKSSAVKRSAKSLVLTATLGKVDGKYLKNKKVTFKFNGKKYTAKTNKKGVAKVTINSSVLKKLKVGKKVTYQATYMKDTVKKTVKIKN